jgi:hypothetical protein
MIDEDKKAALKKAASIIGVPYDWLYNLIKFESNFDAKAKNPLSGARGLIQFTNTTARAMGYLSADDLVNKYPSFYNQLFIPVVDYFKLPASRGPYFSKQSFYMAVFYPRYRTVSPLTEFPEYEKSLNPGIKTVQDYIDFVEGGTLFEKIVDSPKKYYVLSLSVLVTAGILYYIYKNHN